MDLYHSPPGMAVAALPPYPLLPADGYSIASERRRRASSQTTESAPGVPAKLLRMRRLAILSHTLRGGISRVQLLALQGHNHTSERVD